MRKLALIFVMAFLAAPWPAFSQDWPEHPVSIAFMGGASLPIAGEAGETADFNNEMSGITYGKALQFAGVGFIDGTWNFHERGGATFGFGYMRHFSLSTNVDATRDTCTLPDGSPIGCSPTIKFQPDDLQMWPVYLGARYYLTGVNQEEGGIFIRGDVGAVYYQPTKARIYKHYSAGRTPIEQDEIIYDGDWWEGSANILAGAGLGFSFFSGPLGAFGEVRYLYMGAPKAADLVLSPGVSADNKSDPIQAVMVVIGVGGLF